MSEAFKLASAPERKVESTLEDERAAWVEREAPKLIETALRQARERLQSHELSDRERWMAMIELGNKINTELNAEAKMPGFNESDLVVIEERRRRRMIPEHIARLINDQKAGVEKEQLEARLAKRQRVPMAMLVPGSSSIN